MPSDTGPGRLPMRARAALLAARLAAWASQRAGRGKGSMIGGLIALKIEPDLLAELAAGRRTAVVTGTNGKSTTTRMVATAMATTGREVATQADGANMDAGIVAALTAHQRAPLAALEVDELHVPHVLDATDADVLVLLNLTRDQLDRVGEINIIERKQRAAVAAHPEMTVVANCDDVLITSVAYDAENIVWVAAGAGWVSDSVSCPRSGEPIIRDGDHWYSTGADFRRPAPQWWVDDEFLYGPDGLKLAMKLRLPGRANRGNAAQAVAAAVVLGAEPRAAVEAVETVGEVAGRYSTVTVGSHRVRMLLAKNPAGWQEAMSMVDGTAEALVIAVNGQVPDGEDLSWLWDVQFERFENAHVVAAGERGADLAVRLTYAGAEHELIADPLTAIESCPPGRVEVLANYTAFRDLSRAIEARTQGGQG